MHDVKDPVVRGIARGLGAGLALTAMAVVLAFLALDPDGGVLAPPPTGERCTTADGGVVWRTCRDGTCVIRDDEGTTLATVPEHDDGRDTDEVPRPWDCVGD